MRVAEISRDYMQKFYNGNLQRILEAKDYILFNDDRIKRAFNHGKGNRNNMIGYMKYNRGYCIYWDLDRNCEV